MCETLCAVCAVCLLCVTVARARVCVCVCVRARARRARVHVFVSVWIIKQQQQQQKPKCNSMLNIAIYIITDMKCKYKVFLIYIYKTVGRHTSTHYISYIATLTPPQFCCHRRLTADQS